LIVNQKGIEVGPDKIKAIRKMPPPKTEKEVCSFLGHLNYIARFIASLPAMCEPLFKLLRKSQTSQWDEDCQRAFEKIKDYLLKPPVLMPSTPNRRFILYLTILPRSLGAVLG